MKTTLIRFSYLLVLCILLTFCSNDSELKVYEKAEVVDIDITYSKIENEILDLVNKYRVENKLSTLSALNIISNVANSHTEYMIQNGEISHDNFQKRAAELKKNANAKSIGENVAFGYNTAQSVLKGWLNSPEHKKIIETPIYTHFGISTKTDKNGRNYFTQIFIKK